jgi:NAD(P)-dependent dehydrogenase (short-subunit alcohol dehydrogenase family)
MAIQNPVVRRLDLTGRVALVSGGRRGLGKAIAAALTGAGAGVVIASWTESELAATGAEPRDSGGERRGRVHHRSGDRG